MCKDAMSQYDVYIILYCLCPYYEVWEKLLLSKPFLPPGWKLVSDWTPDYSGGNNGKEKDLASVQAGRDGLLG